MNRPTVLTVTRRAIRKDKRIDYTAELHLQLLVRLRLLPLMVPVVPGALALLPQYMEQMHGLLLVEGEDISPENYRSHRAGVPYVEDTDALKDRIEMKALRHALRRRLPVLGICRGAQLLNVLCGGTLYGDVQKEKHSDLRHVEGPGRYDTYRHRVEVVPGTPLARWYRRKVLRVNSYHHQGVRRLGSRFRPMAFAEDGLVEAFYDPGCDFVTGVQFHPERMLAEYAGNWRLWQAFGDAVHAVGR
jgi:putative glutamine amidotransferase